jgi:hypothetical protein
MLTSPRDPVFLKPVMSLYRNIFYLQGDAKNVKATLTQMKLEKLVNLIHVLTIKFLIYKESAMSVNNLHIQSQ